MKNLFLLAGGLFFSLTCFAQVEIPATSKKPVFERPASTGSALPSIMFPETDTREDFKLKDDPRKPKPLEMITKKELLTAGDFIEKKWAEDKKEKSEYADGQNLGNFITKGKFVEIYARDSQYVDGDRVRVYLNGKIVQSNILLHAGFTPVLIPLESGFNTIEIEALNQGSSGPNTAAFAIFDESGKLITSNEWNLLTGAKASLIVVKN